ncbi:MAG: HAMP domain-containing sensor histidine kinase [Clostridia bacterium]|nr:HAMP domain-containing sensor histidine kinase [Clostridia bacterium]
MRRSLKIRLMVIFSAIIIILLGAIFAANALLLDKIYLNDKKESLVATYRQLNSLYEENSSQISLELEKISSTDNITAVIYSAENIVLYSSSSFMPMNMPRQEWDKPPWESNQTNEPSEPSEPKDPKKLDFQGDDDSRRRNEFFANNPHDRILEEGDNYEIRLEEDSRLLSTFIYLTGSLSNGNSLMLRVPYASIAEASGTSNRLLVIIGLFSLVIGVLFIALAAKSITKPVTELSEIAGRMSELDFSRKYAGGRTDEIGHLGASINEMSSKLEVSIAKLKETNEQLKKDIEIINKTDQMRREFIANASHELKTPIALISGYAEGLCDNVATSKSDREFYCGVILDETAKMDKIIRQFLDFMELDYGTQDLNITTFDIRKTIDKVIRTCSFLWQKKGVEPHFDAPDPVLVDADEWKISHAITNYLTNAINHTEGEISITASESENGVRIGVYNSGKQIPEKERDNIWESFYKLDKARTRAYGGTGLGLSIVRSIVLMHAGEYGFENRPNGVEFYIVLKKLRDEQYKKNPS